MIVPASCLLHNGQEGRGDLESWNFCRRVDFLKAVCKTFDSVEACILSDKLSKAWDISGFNKANVCERSSVPYRWFTKLDNSL